MIHTHDHAPSSDPVKVYGDIETEAAGLAYGAMVFTVDAGRTTEPHSHQSQETWWVKSGSGFASVDGKRSELATGSQFTVPANTVHTVTSNAGEALKIVSFWWREAANG
ncbi:MAG: cupin domain-containing protein [Gemmatimonadaceae bacterium]